MGLNYGSVEWQFEVMPDLSAWLDVERGSYSRGLH